jgi:hypothetical protein
MMAAAIAEAPLTREQAAALAALMDEARPTRPAGVVTAALLYEDGMATLVACWASRDELDRYLEEVDVPRGVELMRRVGAEPTLRVVELLELG